MWLILAGFFMGGNFPERVFPGVFDIFGYGHQVLLLIGLEGVIMYVLAVSSVHHDGHLACVGRSLPGLPVRPRHAGGLRHSTKRHYVSAHRSRTSKRPKRRAHDLRACGSVRLLRILRLLLHAAGSLGTQETVEGLTMQTLRTSCPAPSSVIENRLL